MELGTDRRLLACWPPTSPVTCQVVSEGVFCTVTVRCHCRETGLKKGFSRSVVMIVLVSLLETVMVVMSCMKWETGRRLLPLCGGSAWLPKHAFLTSLGFWFLIFSRTVSSSSWIQPATVYSHCLERKDTKRVFVLFFKEAHYQLTGLFSACFPWNLLFQIIFFFSLVWLGSTGEVEWAETHQPLASCRSRMQFWGEGGSDLPQKLATFA